MVSVSESTVIPAPDQEVWKVLADVENARNWNGAWTRIELTSSQRHGLGTTFAAHTEVGDVFEFEISEWTPPERIAFSPIRGEGERFAIMLDRHEFQLSAVGDDATLVKLTAHATAHGLKRHVIARLFWPGYQKQGLKVALDGLQAGFEPEPQAQAEEEAAESGSPAAE